MSSDKFCEWVYLLLPIHVHCFNTWRNPNTDRPAMPCYGCWDAIGQSLFSQSEVNLLLYTYVLVRYLHFMSVVLSSRYGHCRWTHLWSHLFTDDDFLIRLKLTYVKILQFDPSNSSAVISSDWMNSTRWQSRYTTGETSNQHQLIKTCKYFQSALFEQ